MKQYSIITIAALLLFGCSTDSKKSEIMGVWVSNKEMSFCESQAGGDFANSKIKDFATTLGTMAYVFEESRTTFTPISEIKEQSSWFKWKLLSSSPRHYSIGIYQKESYVEVRFVRLDGCIGREYEEFSFVEYFCKQ